MNLQHSLLEEFEKIIDYSFKNKQLLVQSLTHKSFAHEQGNAQNSNERLEFLGDAVLELFVSKKLYLNFSSLAEGNLSKLRASIVNGEELAKIAKFLTIDKTVQLGKGESNSLGNNKYLASAFEAVVGAIYLDSTYEIADEVLDRIFTRYEEKVDPTLFQAIRLDYFDAKSKLNELSMKLYKELPVFQSSKALNGQDSFAVELYLVGKKIGELTHHSKRKAEKLLAEKILTEKTYLNLRD